VLGVRQTGSSSPASSKKKGSSTGANRGNGTDEKDGNGEKAPASAVASRPLPAEQAGKLPYTGSDVVLALLVASCLLAAGLGLRRLTARTGVH
jgi:hypothetical protein